MPTRAEQLLMSLDPDGVLGLMESNIKKEDLSESEDDTADIMGHAGKIKQDEPSESEDDGADSMGHDGETNQESSSAESTDESPDEESSQESDGESPDFSDGESPDEQVYCTVIDPSEAARLDGELNKKRKATLSHNVRRNKAKREESAGERSNEEDHDEATDPSQVASVEAGLKEIRNICSRGGCQNRSVNGGLCQRHGAKRRRCSVEGCNSQNQQKGVCHRHVAQAVVCSHDGCTKWSQYSGFCSRHRKRNTCSQEGCTRASQGHKLFCWGHLPTETKKCKKKGCEEWAMKNNHHGLCQNHFAKAKFCSRDGCDYQARVRGLCSHHGVKRIREECSAEDCLSKAHLGGFCKRHRNRAELCSTKGCAGIALRNKAGLCSKHLPSRICLHNKCTTKVKDGEYCARHKRCSAEGCMNVGRVGKPIVCWGHSPEDAVRKLCSHEKCTNLAITSGVCITHGAKKYMCKVVGCDKQVVNNRVCCRHGAVFKACSHEGCTNRAVNKTDVCTKHGALIKTCRYDGCNKNAQIGSSVCPIHSGKQILRICSTDGCKGQIFRDGACRSHYGKSRIRDAVKGESHRVTQPQVGSKPNAAKKIVRICSFDVRKGNFFQQKNAVQGESHGAKQPDINAKPRPKPASAPLGKKMKFRPLKR